MYTTTDTDIMVQIADREWTFEALHCACVMARKTSTRIALVKMIPVQNPRWLGTDLGYMNYTYQQQKDFAEYEATIEDYGIGCFSIVFQYESLSEGLVQAAEQVNAQVIFAPILQSRISLWRQFQTWWLKRQFARENRAWIQHPAYEKELTPSVVNYLETITSH